MNLVRRIRKASRAFWEGAVQRIGVERIRSTYQDQFKDYSKGRREVLQSKSRYFYNNATLPPRLADVFEQGVVGTGLVVNPSSTDQKWNKANRLQFKIWEEFPDISSRQTFGMLQGLIACDWFVDGEAFAVKATGETNRPRLRLIEAHRVATPPSETKREGLTVVDGVERDMETGRPTGYWISRDVEDGSTKWDFYKASDVFHVFEPSRPNQYRGVPFFAPCLNTLQDMERLERLEMKAANASAVYANILTTQSGEADGADLIASGGSVTTASNGSVDAVKESFGGETIVLQPGEDMKQFAPARPSVVTREYWAYLREKVCMGVGIPSVLAHPESMQGTVYRGAMDGAAAFFRARSAVMQDFVRRVYVWVTEENIKREKSVSNAPSDGTWRQVKIYPPRAVNVDVGRNSSAMLAELAAGATTYDDVYGPLGQFWQDKFDELAKQREYGKELGLIAGGGGPSDVQMQALNGAQLQSVQLVIQSVSLGQMPAESAKRLLYIALPTTDRAEIDAMVDAAASFTPRPPPDKPNDPPNNDGEEPPTAGVPA